MGHGGTKTSIFSCIRELLLFKAERARGRTGEKNLEEFWI